MRAPALPSIVLLSIALFGCSDGGSPAATAGELTESLAGASAGDVVEVGDVTIEGSFVVPAGVTLRGTASGSRILAPNAGMVAIEVTAGSADDPTVVSDLTVESAGAAAIAVPPGSAGGTVRLERLLVGVGLGVGIAAESLHELSVTDVTVAGSVDESSIATLPLDPQPTDAPTHGFVAVRVAAVVIEDLDVSGFARFGVLLIESGTTWTGGESRVNAGTCVMSIDGDFTASGVSASEALESDSVFPSYGVVLAGTGTSMTTDLQLANNQGVAALITQSGGSLTDTVVTGNSTGVWVQGATGFAMGGANTDVADNDFAGIVLRDTSMATIEDATVRGTRLVARAVESTSVEMADGLQLVGGSDVTVMNTTFENNGRVGVLLDLDGGATSQVTLEAVDVSVTDTALGVIAQNGTTEAGWDSGVTRDATATTNDEAHLQAGVPLDVVAGILPIDIPAPDDLRVSGIAALGVGQ